MDPENTSVRGAQSPEGQAFVVEMHAAWQDWVASGSPGVIPAAQTPGAKAAAVRTPVRGIMAVAGGVVALALAVG